MKNTTKQGLLAEEAARQFLIEKIGRAHVLNSSHIPLSRMPSSA